MCDQYVNEFYDAFADLVAEGKYWHTVCHTMTTEDWEVQEFRELANEIQNHYRMKNFTVVCDVDTRHPHGFDSYFSETTHIVSVEVRWD